jgi:putative ABC transport system permease protein
MGLDLRAAVRSIARSPGFFLSAALTLALGLGAVVTSFGLLAGALGSSIGNGNAEPVVLYLTEQTGGRFQQMRWPYAGVEYLRGAAQSYQRIASYTIGEQNLSGTRESARVNIEFVSPEYFDVIAAAPLLGRVPLSGSSETPGSPAEIVLGHAMWQRLFGGDRSALGQSVVLSREPLTIVGVMPEGFRGLSGRAEAFVPHTMSPRVSYARYFTSQDYFHNVIATLKPGVDRRQAESELKLIATRMAAAVPSRSEGATARGGLVVPFADARRDASVVRARAYVAVGAVLVLLIAGVNLANLVSTRVVARQREFGVRLAVGASRYQVARTVGIEMAIVAACGFGLALLLSAWTRDLVMLLVPSQLANSSNDYGQISSFRSFEINGVVGIVTAVFGLLTMAGASVLATRPFLRMDLASTLRSGGDRSATRGPGAGGRLLLVVQVAASLSLVASAGLVLKSVSALDHRNPGFDADRVLAFSIAEDLAVQHPGSGPALVDRLLAGLGAIGGVEAVTTGQCTPYGSRCARLGFWLDGQAQTSENMLVTGWHRVGPGHFGALKIPIVRGRDFSGADRRGQPQVVVISETAARRFFPDRDPIGLRITLPEVVEGDPETAEIVGIAGDVTYWPLDEAPGPAIYQPALQFSHPFMTVMVRVSEPQWRRSMLGESSQPMFETMRRAMAGIDPNLPLFDMTTMNELARAGRADRGFVSVLLGACAFFALLLAAIGIYGLTMAWFQSRRKELGVRVALGANPASLVRNVMAGALWQTLIGVIVGIGLALAAGRALRSLLFEVGPNDPAALAFSAAVMLTVAGVAAWLPARRALRIDATEQLRAD